jgi:hypothetical protein
VAAWSPYLPLGLRAPRLLIADGHLGIWGAVGAVFLMVGEQRG